MNRVLMSYLNQLYVPSQKRLEALGENNFHRLKEAIDREQEILKCWDNIEISSLTTSVDKKDHIVEADAIDVQCAVNLGGAPPELFCVELFHMFDNKSSYRVLPMKLRSAERTTAHYECSFKIEGYGLQSVNARIRPADETVQDLHPEWAKWKE